MTDEISLANVFDPTVPKNEIIYNHSIAFQCFLPVRSLPKEEDIYKTDNGNSSLIIHAGILVNPTNPNEVERCEVPAGSKARLIFAYVNDQLVKTGNPTIEMGENMHNFMIENGIKPSGANAAELVRQLKNIAAANVLIGVWEPGVSAGSVRLRFTEEDKFWLDKKNKTWKTTLTFSPEYVKSLGKRRVPVDFRALTALQANPRAMDVYMWLSYRLRTVNSVDIIPWTTLHKLFGQGIAELRNFKIHFKKAVAEAYKYYPAARLGFDEEDYVELYYAPPPVPYK